MRALVALSAVLALAALPACAGGEAVTAPALAGTTWSEHCPGAPPETTFLRLESDGTFSYNYDAPQRFEPSDGDDTWAVEGGSLVISWNDGFAVTRYDLSAFQTGTLTGSSTKDCGDRARFVRV